ncbi:MAG: hypothetical protein KC430_09260 [Amylibacter sp.]|nr:hypothetical protein [Amylibacter sp.]
MGVVISSVKLLDITMLYNLDIKEHFYKTLIVSFVSCIMMLFVTELVVPIQSYFLPEITLYAALIFPVHGIRVLSAWLFGWASVFYLFVSNIFIFFLLSRHEENIYALLSTQSVIAWVLVSVISIFTFDLLRVSGVDIKTTVGKFNKDAWKLIILVGFISSVFNSLGHNLIFTSTILPENSLRVILAFLFGDTTGTVACLFILIYVFKFLRRFPTLNL